MPDKPTLAMYWAASCGGCEISLLNLHERLLTLAEAVDIVFFPCIADFKVTDVEHYPDGFIDLCLFNGAIRNDENAAMARLLRRKSKVLVAYGSCAYEGCIPALANLTSRQAVLETVYRRNPTVDNPTGSLPQERTETPAGTLTLPRFWHTVRALDQVVPVDYYLPGCPPEPERIWEGLQALLAALEGAQPWPEPGTVLGHTGVAVCHECPLRKGEKAISAFVRPHQHVPDPEVCLLEQGLVCLGPATVGGCGARCPQVGMGCRGCYGPLPGIVDQGAKALAALASVLEVGDPSMDEDDLTPRIAAAVDTLADPAGTVYRFSLAHSLLMRARTPVREDEHGPTHHH